MTKILYPEFHSLLCNVISLKYRDGHIDDCAILIKLYEYKTEMLKIRQNEISKGRFSPPISNINTEDVVEHQIILDNIEQVSKSINDITRSIYDYIDEITELKLYTYKNSLKKISLYKLERGCVHSVEGPAFFLTDTFTQYFIYGDIVRYEDWKKHPLVRKHKIEKIRNGQRNSRNILERTIS